MTKIKKVISWMGAVLAAIVMLQTLYFKFSAAPESVYIFTKLGLEPYGRIGVGILEMISSVLLIIPRTRFYGALLGVGLMSGAIFAHFTQLGIEVEDDGGYLFILSLVVTVACGICLFLQREKFKTFLNF
jgi:putative oxidoreductase